MKQLVFNTRETGIARLETLQTELKNIGINGFEVDFVVNQISVTCTENFEVDKLKCAIKKAGLECHCLRECHITD